MLKIGQSYFIRTVTNYFTGRLVVEQNGMLLLEEAAWIADTGRFADALAGGQFDEVEPYPNTVIVMKSAIVDICDWPHALPRAQK